MHDGEGDKFSAESRSRQSLYTPDSCSYKHEMIHSSGFEPLRPQGIAFIEALLLELSFHIVHTPSGCRLMQGTFAMSADQAASSISRRCWGARLTWATQRAHAMNIAYAIARMEQLLSDF